METEYRSFLMIYCRAQGVFPADFPTEVLLKTLYPHARPLFGLLTQLNPDFFRPDYEFIEDVSCMQNHRDLSHAVENYVTNPANKGFIRRRLRLRISVRRMLRLVHGVFPQELSREVRDRMQAKNTLTPFDEETPGKTQSSEEAKPGLD
jgi:hypothetical protein